MAPPKSTKSIVKQQGRDIRGFFGGGGTSTQTTPRAGASRIPANEEPAQKSKSKVINISDDDDEPLKSSNTSPVPKKSNGEHIKLKSERSMDVSDEERPPAPTLKRKKAAVLLSSDDEDEDIKKSSSPRKKAATSAVIASSMASSSALSKPTPRPEHKEPTSRKANPPYTNSRTNAKRIKGKDDDDYKTPLPSEDDRDDNAYVNSEDDDAVIHSKVKRKTKPIAKPPPPKVTQKAAPKGKNNAKLEDTDVGAKEALKPKKFNWAASKAAKMAGPVAHGSKEVPNPAHESPLSGLSFVFTGELTSFSRDEIVDLAKRFGGRVLTQPSSKTSFVVLGTDAGPKKLEAIKKNALKTLDEDQFLELIATRNPGSVPMDEKTRKKLEKEENTIRQGAKDLERRESNIIKSAASGGRPKPEIANQLWTTRYAPQSLKEVCGNKGQVEKLQLWLHDWETSRSAGFKKPGKNGMNIFRGVMITGPPGIGKTTSAHLCAKLEGYTPIELNASDARSKKLVENSTNITNKSLDGWMSGGQMKNVMGVTTTNKTCLIMDEVDGMSAGDRGGVGALAALIKKTDVPIICIANDRGAQKLKPLLNNTFNLSFTRPPANVVRSRILTIAFKEKMKIPANVIDELLKSSQSDIRQVLNMLSTWKLQSDTMDFDEGKSLAKMNEKYSIMTPFTVIDKLLGPYMFSHTSRETLNDKMEMYFHDHSFIPLFIQENYLKTYPARVKNLDGPDKTLKQLELMDKAAASISDGDLVDALIHGPEQHWSLMPLHAVCSTIRPASFLYGMGMGYKGPGSMSFPQWLGQNSKQTKLSRQLTEIQAHVRLRVSANKFEIRQSYLPAMFPHIVKPLMDDGASAVDEVIDTMDKYFLNREDWDTIVELGLDEHKDAIILKKIPTATKTSFTKKYNLKDHPIAFHKAQDLGKVPKKLAAAGPLPDLEEAFDADDEIMDEIPEEKNSDEDDITRDSLIKAPKKKGKSEVGKLANTKSKAKR